MDSPWPPRPARQAQTSSLTFIVGGRGTVVCIRCPKTRPTWRCDHATITQLESYRDDSMRFSTQIEPAGRGFTRWRRRLPHEPVFGRLGGPMTGRERQGVCHSTGRVARHRLYLALSLRTGSVHCPHRASTWISGEGGNGEYGLWMVRTWSMLWPRMPESALVPGLPASTFVVVVTSTSTSGGPVPVSGVHYPVLGEGCRLCGTG
ncbi:hypothetical protein C8F01DRAFT_669113 [Mycena amicta]|nr:hypothetical protein C8F01DRAFT_669113 [Mycena amicta]